jgi:hypothetical protein
VTKRICWLDFSISFLPLRSAGLRQLEGSGHLQSRARILSWDHKFLKGQATKGLQLSKGYLQDRGNGLSLAGGFIKSRDPGGYLVYATYKL